MKFSEVWMSGKLKSSKHADYLAAYDEIFEKFKTRDIKVLEFGVSTGGSLESYSNYFSENSVIVGVDLDPACKEIPFQKKNIEVIVGDMTDRNLYEHLKNRFGKFDLVIDDGGHTNLQMMAAFAYSQMLLNGNSVYVTEDTHCSYVTKFGNPSKFSFMSFVKELIDRLTSERVTFRGGLQLSSLTICSGLVVFSFSESLAVKNNKIYNNGMVTSRVTDRRHQTNVSSPQKILLSLYSIIISSKLYSYLESRSVKNIVIMLYKSVLNFVTPDKNKIINLRKEVLSKSIGSQSQQ